MSALWNEDDFDVLCEGAVVGQIMMATVPVERCRIDRRNPALCPSRRRCQEKAAEAGCWVMP